MSMTGNSITSTTWNGGHCPTCGANWLNSHACTREDIARRIGELADLLRTMQPQEHVSPPKWRRANGCDACRRSGVCGCILSGPEVTC